MLRAEAAALSESERLTTLAHELGRVDREWAILAEGNCSMLTDAGVVRVKASGAGMSRATTDDFVDVPLNELLSLIDRPGAGDADVQDVFDAVATRSRGRRPSVESLLHAVCLDQPGVTWVGHTHPIPVNAILSSSRPTLLTDGALFPDQVVVLGTRPLLVPYVDPGLHLAQEVRRLLRERAGDVPRAIYLQNHGMFALGNSSAEVLQITEMAVKVARVLIGACSVGQPAYMDPRQVARIDTRPDELLRRATLQGKGVA
ncbi:class II aldolase/adducin family protein [Cellulomonas sp. McL0617]|uniref:class II aldolase/adducin family protein n=1 Tax=Cellulomonas sp. McL0617 TaxID=3415675 RepID=UPI003CE80860